jgi:hypothetical protein
MGISKFECTFIVKNYSGLHSCSIDWAISVTVYPPYIVLEVERLFLESLTLAIHTKKAAIFVLYDTKVLR